jgi:hypothetical protein
MDAAIRFDAICEICPVCAGGKGHIMRKAIRRRRVF